MPIFHLCQHLAYVTAVIFDKNNERCRISAGIVSLTLKGVVDDLLKFSLHFPEKIELDISRESSAYETIHIKCQALLYFGLVANLIMMWCKYEMVSGLRIP